ncbi:MAG: hypothetical protein II392_01320 [Mycoplasma sp.]|nr:hypothetical protein [Mycoplasma sp.]
MNFINQFRSFMQNPTQFLMQSRLGLTPEMLQDPQQAIQQLMNQGKITQDQYNWAVNQANQIKNNPQINQYFQNINKW